MDLSLARRSVGCQRLYVTLRFAKMGPVPRQAMTCPQIFLLSLQQNGTICELKDHSTRFCLH